jgi:hypothetical protein
MGLFSYSAAELKEMSKDRSFDRATRKSYKEACKLQLAKEQEKERKRQEREKNGGGFWSGFGKLVVGAGATAAVGTLANRGANDLYNKMTSKNG